MTWQSALRGSCFFFDIGVSPCPRDKSPPGQPLVAGHWSATKESKLMKIKAEKRERSDHFLLAVIDATGIHALVFPCRRVLGG